MKDIKKLECNLCDNKCNIQRLSKEDISFCPYCGEDIFILDEAPLLSTFDELDDFED